MKSKSTAYLLWLISVFGIFGFHQFYLGKTGKGIVYIFTLGIFGFGAFFDLFSLGGQVDNCNTKQELGQLRATTSALAAAALSQQR